MTQEDKELLLQDLCARLPYGVKCKWEHEYDGKTYTGGGVLCDIDHVKTSNGYRYWDCYFEDEGDDIPIELVKPYLRPMSSMTEKEKEEFHKLKQFSVTVVMPNEVSRIKPTYIVDLEDDGDGLNYLYDWLNAHHFDYRRLIDKGLALEAPDGMYK